MQTVSHNFMTTVTSTDPNLEFRDEYDLFRQVYYNQEPFTGLLKDGDEETEYVNGNAHGKYTVLFDDGSTHTKAIFQDGEEIESTSYYKSGKLISEQNQEFSKLWNEHGQLITETYFVEDVKKTYFPSGSLKSIHSSENENWRVKYFTAKGELVITILPKSDNTIYNSGAIYEYDVLLKNYFDLLNNDYLELEFEQAYEPYESHRIHLIWMWFWEVFDKDQNQYFGIVNNLIKHPNRKVLESIASIIAIHKFEPYIEKENELNKDCFTLIKKDRAYQDKYYPNRDYKKVVL